MNRYQDIGRDRINRNWFLSEKTGKQSVFHQQMEVTLTSFLLRSLSLVLEKTGVAYARMTYGTRVCGISQKGERA